MNREKYRRFLVMMFVVYLFLFIYYLSYTIYTQAFNETATVIHLEEQEKKLMPLGMTVGVYIRSKGIMVLDTSELTGIHGEKTEPGKDVLKSGDYIMCFNGKTIDSIHTFTEMVNENGSHTCTLTVSREGTTMELDVTPVQTENNSYKLGVWVRQDAQGIGTLSFVDEYGHFAALGHGITDVDIDQMIEINYGKLYEPNILSVVKGKSGEPGKIIGHIDYQENFVLGDIQTNSEHGIMGVFNENVQIYDEEQAMYTAKVEEVEEGDALIRCSVDGEVKDYAVKIESICRMDFGEDKDFVVRITDAELLMKTNGIVQGMSGSPVIQNGRIVGAVTHVLVNDPTRGYGIFIENMLEAAE